MTKLSKLKKPTFDCQLSTLDRLAQKLRPYIPFTALNTVWRKLDKDSKLLLDVGCGKGEPMRFINRRKRFYAVGVDIFEPYHQESRKSGCYDELILADIRNPPLKPKSFDIVFAMEVLEHLEKQEGERLLHSMERIVRKQMILSTPVGKYKQDPYDGNPSQEHKHIWNPATIEKLGYKVSGCGIRNIGGRHGLVARLPKKFRPLGDMAWVLAGPLARLFPSLAGDMVCSKRLEPQEKKDKGG